MTKQIYTQICVDRYLYDNTICKFLIIICRGARDFLKCPLTLKTLCSRNFVGSGSGLQRMNLTIDGEQAWLMRAWLARITCPTLEPTYPLSSYQQFTVCSISLGLFYIVTYHIELAKTSWTYSIILISMIITQEVTLSPSD